MGRQHQGMDRPGVRNVPESSGEQGEMEKTGAPTTLAVKGLMMRILPVQSPLFNSNLLWGALRISIIIKQPQQPEEITEKK